MELREFISITSKGDRIFQSTLYRNFGNNAPEVQKYLLDNKYATPTTAYRCPECDFLLGIKKVNYCYCRDREFSLEDIESEIALDRTDKKLEEIT